MTYHRSEQDPDPEDERGPDIRSDATTEFEPFFDEAPESRSPGAAGARQSIVDAADRIGRWFAGLDRRPEYEHHADRDALDDDLADELDDEPGGARSVQPAPVHRRRHDLGRRQELARHPEPVGRDEPVVRHELVGRQEPVRRAPWSHAPEFVEDAYEPVASDERGDHAAHADAHEPAPRPSVHYRPESGRVSEPDPEGSSRFPVKPLGYERQAVDEHVAALERELSALRGEVIDLREQVKHDAPMSVQEELERIGEQTASILVVAHDKAYETTRLAQEQAERCITDAASNAVAITEEAKRRLRELDEETDAVWRERERLLEDVRAVSSSLGTLADEATERFPADPRSGEEPVAASAEPAATSAGPAVTSAEPRVAGFAEHAPASAFAEPVAVGAPGREAPTS